MTDATPPPTEIGYADALAELEGILDELDGDEVDVDVLGERVRRAAELLRLCRERIAGARFEVEQVVGELEAEADAAAAAAGTDDSVDAGDGDDVADDDTDDDYTDADLGDDIDVDDVDDTGDTGDT
jgi:exodeoxyribonuclease VII small subunit